MIPQVSHPENQKEDIGHFMVAAGAIIRHPIEEKILILKRVGPHQKDQWEIVYGRISQHEELIQGLKREIMEETHLQSVVINNPLCLWHAYRGDKHSETEVYGLTFVCSSVSSDIQIDPSEHSAYQWVTSDKALELIKEPGIKRDIELYIQNPNQFHITTLENKTAL